MKINEKMIAQMTEEEQQELFDLIWKQQEKKKKKKKVTENLVQELRKVINKMIDENILFDYLIEDGNLEYFRLLDVEVKDDGKTVLLTFYE